MKRIAVILVLVAIVISSCARLREARAAKHQPFKPHKEKRMKKGKNR